MTDRPKAGDVLRYPYLWARQSQTGETEGRKLRPCAVILSLATVAGQTELRICAITTKPPSKGVHAVVVPEIERRRAGLDTDLDLWVILHEHNVDVFEQSFYIEPGSALGQFSAAFTKELQRGMIAALKARSGDAVQRR
jgi:hypothetical protein